MSVATGDYEHLNKVKVTPANNTIQFPDVLDKEYKQEIIITNPTDLQMTYRIICSSSDIGFRPSCGYVKPKNKSIVEAFSGPIQPTKKIIGFVVRWVIAGTAFPTNAEDMWIANIVPNKLYQVVKMKVVFGAEPNEKSRSERSGKSFSSTSEAMM